MIPGSTLQMQNVVKTYYGVNSSHSQRRKFIQWVGGMQEGLLKQNRTHRDLMVAYSSGILPSKHLASSFNPFCPRIAEANRHSMRPGSGLFSSRGLDFPSGRQQASVQQLMQG